MSTDELARLEQLLATALREGDGGPVDVPGGRTRLARRLGREKLVRRWTVVGVAAAVLAVVVTTSLLLAGLRHDEESLPVSPPKIALSPSGLPVGLLEGRVTRSTGDIAVSIVRLQVRPDGTGTLALGGFDSGEQAASGYDVEYVRLGPGQVAVRYHGPICASDRAFTFEFTVRGRTLTIDPAESPGCLVREELSADLPGATFRIRPPPEELSDGSS